MEREERRCRGEGLDPNVVLSVVDTPFCGLWTLAVELKVPLSTVAQSVLSRQVTRSYPSEQARVHLAAPLGYIYCLEILGSAA
eukprot:6188999-Pleurochrysis_carterae.AAC.2